MKELYITDLDGTLLNEEKKVSLESIAIINRFVEEGGLFSVATARTAGTVVGMLKDLQIHCPVVLMNGAMIFDLENKSYITYQKIPEDGVLTVCQLIKKHGANGFLYTLEGNTIVSYYTDLKGTVEDFYQQRKEAAPYKIFRHTMDFSRHSMEECVYFALIDRKEVLDRVQRELNHPDLAHTLYHDIYDGKLYYLEIFSKKATKANGVRFVKDYIGAKRVIAFGDNNNDLDMLELADVAVVPENGILKAKERADEICKANTEDGVADYIKRTVFKVKS